MTTKKDGLESLLTLKESKLATARDGGDPLEIARALRDLADVERRSTQSRERAREHLEEAIALLRGLHEPITLAHAIRHVGILLEADGRLTEAETLYDESLAIHRTAADRGEALDLANAIRYPASIKWQLRKHTESAPLWEEAAGHYERAGIAEGVAEAAGRLALIAHLAGQRAAAENWFQRAFAATAGTTDADTRRFISEVQKTLAAGKPG